MPTVNFFTDSGTVTTTDNTPTSIVAAGLGSYDNSACDFKVRVLARATDGLMKSWYLSFLGKRGTGDVSLVGSVQNLVPPDGDLGAALWDVDVVNTGSTLYVKGKGVNNKTIDWWARFDGVVIQN